MLQALNGRVEQGGQFRITNVPPGRYLAQVRTDPRGPGGRGGGGIAADEFGRQEITVGGEDLEWRCDRHRARWTHHRSDRQ